MTAVTTRRKRVIARALHPAVDHRGHLWYLTLECGHHVWRPDSLHGGSQKTADCWNCPPKVRSTFAQNYVEAPRGP